MLGAEGSPLSISEAMTRSKDIALKRKELENDPARKAQMVEFLRQSGGRVGFDKYMTEHLFSPIGYYESLAELGADFVTDASNPRFASVNSLYLKGAELPSNIMELGGGNGSLKRNMLAEIPELQYTSVEKSTKLLGEQARFGGTNIQADVTNIPVPDQSFYGLILSNELMDEMSCRVLRLGHAGGLPTAVSEGYVQLGERNQIQFSYDQPVLDEGIDDLQKYLAETNFEFVDGDVICYSLELRKLISESIRVLDTGRILFWDYGYSKSNPKLHREKHVTPFYYGDGKFNGVNEILSHPYSTDLTFYPDFDYAVWVAKDIDSGVRAECGPDYEFCQRFWPTVNEDILGHGFDRGSGYVEIIKG